MTGHFTDEDMQMAYKCMKKHSTSLDIKEIQIKIIMRYHYIAIRMTKIKKSENVEQWKGVKKLRNSYTAGENVE